MAIAPQPSGKDYQAAVACLNKLWSESAGKTGFFGRITLEVELKNSKPIKYRKKTEEEELPP